MPLDNPQKINPQQIKSKEVIDLENKEQKLQEDLGRILNAQKENTQKIIDLTMANDKTNEQEVNSGFNKEEIQKDINSNKESKKTESEDLKRKLIEEKQEEINKTLIELRASINERKEREANIIKLIAHRAQLVEEEIPPKEIKQIEKSKIYALESQRLTEQLNNLPKKDKSRKYLYSLIMDNGKKMEEALIEELEADRKAKPFNYFIVSKIRNESLLKFLKDKNNRIDLRHITDPDNYERKFDDPRHLNNNQDENFVRFNLFGFVQVIKKNKQVTNRKNTDIDYPQVVYKILDPNGKIIEDDIKGLNIAEKIYFKTTEEYKDKVEKEFSNLNNQ